MGEMKRANAYEEERRVKDRFASTLVIAASIIAAVRLARDEHSRLIAQAHIGHCGLRRAGADDLGEGVAVNGIET